MNCKHPSNKVTADVLQGEGNGRAVQWCRICGAFRVVVSAFKSTSTLRVTPYTSPWTEPWEATATEPLPAQLADAWPVILYFANEQDKDAFIREVRKARPELLPQTIKTKTP